MCRNHAVICKYWKVPELKRKFISRGQPGEWRRLEAATSFISSGASKRATRHLSALPLWVCAGSAIDAVRAAPGVPAVFVPASGAAAVMSGCGYLLRGTSTSTAPCTCARPNVMGRYSTA